jgi:hypothetical protein
MYTRYIQYIQIPTYTYTYIHIHTPGNQCLEGILCCSGSCTRRLCTAVPTQIISDGARGGLAERETSVECLLAAQGVHFRPPNACCMRWCSKTGPGVGPQWPRKVVGHLPRGALSGAWHSACRVQPQRGVFWGRCAGIRACLGQYIPYIQHTCAYIQCMQYMHIWIEKDTYTIHTIHTHVHSVLTWANTYHTYSIHAHTYNTYNICTYGLKYVNKITYKIYTIHTHMH